MKLHSISLAVLLSIGSVGVVQGADIGESSDNFKIVVGSTGSIGPGQSVAGIGFGIKDFYNGIVVAFSGFQRYADVNGVVLLSPYLVGAPPYHERIGYSSYKQVPTQDVWFGEWNAEAKDANGYRLGTVDPWTHTVYYNGKDADTSVPSTGTANYSVQGINNYNGSNLLSGTFTANFATKQLTGSLSDSSRTFNLGTATISNDATISGSNASWVGGPSGGEVFGQFYNSQTSLAGMAMFAGYRAYDVAFGGKK
ncbi:Slam-dependent surface lipoprotein [Acinetobacter nematophilus]|uniref:Slam-dependent surface lipoprotein n=1 Tax=Acinetobacter nematophilus TaxID=2994642 RepID=UPI003AF78202